MSLDFNDIVKQGEVKLKSRKVGVWQKRWIIFRKKSSGGPRRLEKYPDVKFAEIGQQAKTISLEKVRAISKTASDGKRCMIEIQPEEGPQRLLMFADEAEASAWEEALRYECLDTPALHGTNGEHLPDTINGEMFYVNLIPSMALALSGECLLQVTSDNLILCDISAPSQELISWPLNCLRRYGGDQNQFMFESGRHCKTGEGLFIFSTVQGEMIYQKVHSATTAICEAHRLLQRREKDGPASPTESPLRNGKKAVGHSVSCPIPSDIPPIPPPRPRPSLTEMPTSNGNIPASRTSSLPIGAMSSLGATSADFFNNNSGAQAEGGSDPDYAEKYLDANFCRFLATRKDDMEPAPSQRLLNSPSGRH